MFQDDEEEAEGVEGGEYGSKEEEILKKAIDKRVKKNTLCF